MIFTKRIMHVYHSSRQLFAREKSALATLRKKTGYSISNCKKALEMHNNDLGAAENWLQDQAQALGWKKASKVEGRLTAQGLIGVIVKNPYAALIELNCETDFVAKSKEFKHMVEVAAYSCVNFISKHNNLKAPIIKHSMYWLPQDWTSREEK
ncbi:hypothetical protein HHI36_004834 [Cryptolaemus montrouzieri]|uniref:Elongation factor Ts, mitochondrial n=1 Tax=Cryptolaemus montrouzieri TaxID=559131 RepID=A0ABD2NSD7_9CUCU